jgi:hypothetical protein
MTELEMEIIQELVAEVGMNLGKDEWVYQQWNPRETYGRRCL